MNWTHQIISYAFAFFVGAGLGKVAGASMPARGLSWTWTLVSALAALVLPPSIGLPSWVGIFALTVSCAAMLTYAYSEVAGRRARGENLYTPIDALRQRWGRAVATVCVILPLIHRPKLLDVLGGLTLLLVMWVYGERNALRALALPKAIEVIARHDPDRARWLEEAVSALIERIKHH